jgi:hypothetical protein
VLSHNIERRIELPRNTEDRSVIGTHGFLHRHQQTNGMPMLLYAIDEVPAFEVLRWRSQGYVVVGAAALRPTASGERFHQGSADDRRPGRRCSD